MNNRISSAAFALALMTTGTGAHAFGNACRNVDFSVDNDFRLGGQPREIRVERFELFSQSEGRFLNEGFANTDVPAGAQGFVVRRGETVEHAENDRITQIRVSFSYVDPRNGRRVNETFTDRDIANPICVAGKRYQADINMNVRPEPL